jgi:hypothetical protein
MTERQVKARLTKHHPHTVVQILENCGVPLKFLDGGAFRKVYEIPGLPLVLKVPISWRHLQHAKNEYKAWVTVSTSKKFECLRKYMPEVLYFNVNSGILLMRKYAPLKPKRKFSKQLDEIEALVTAITGGTDADLGKYKADNFGLAEDGTLRVIDLGLFLSGE